MCFFYQERISLLCCQNPGSRGKQSWRSMLQRGLFKGFQWSPANWCNTRGRFQEGMPLRPLGLSLQVVQETSKILIVLTLVTYPVVSNDWSGWSSLSLNSYCHCFREALLLDCWGSRSHACRSNFDRFLWGVWLDGWESRLDRYQGIWPDMTQRFGAVSVIPLHG